MYQTESEARPEPARPLDPVFRAALRILPIALAVYTALLSALVLVRSSKVVFNDMRGGPALAVAHGFPIYPMGLENVSFLILYGPLSYIFQLPATLFHSPGSYFLAGCLVSFVLYCAPLVYFLTQSRPGSQNRLAVSLFLAAGFILFSLNSKSLVYSAASFSPDAAAVGFAGLACAVMFFHKDRRPWRDPILIALFTCCATGSKQNVGVLMVVLPLFGLYLYGRSFAIRLVVCLGVGLLITVGVVWAVYHDLSAVYFNNFVIPKRVPFLWRTAPAAAQLLYAQALPILIVIASLLVVTWGRATDRRVLLFAGMAICFTPLSLMGMCWWGGDVNALTPALYFVLLTLLALSYTILVEQSSGWPEHSKALAIVALFAVLNAPLFDPFATRPAGMATESTLEAYVRDALRRSPSESAYRYDTQHPGDIYFPFNQASVYLAEHKFYHADWGMASLILAKYPITADQVWRHVPPAARYVAYPPGVPSRWLLPYTSPHLRTVDMPSLPGFSVVEIER